MTMCLDRSTLLVVDFFFFRIRLKLTSTSKLTSSPSRKTIVQTRPFLIGIDWWCLLIEWIFPLEFNKLGRNLEFEEGGGGGFSSFKVVAWCFPWRRLKKRINRAAAMNDVPCTNGLRCTHDKNNNLEKIKGKHKTMTWSSSLVDEVQRRAQLCTPTHCSSVNHTWREEMKKKKKKK